MAADLVFKAAQTYNPNLVFGEDGGAPPITDAVVSFVASLPGLQGAITTHLGVTVAFAAALPGLSGTIGVRYDSRTERPTVNQVRSRFQDGDDLETGVEQRWQQARPLAVPMSSTYEQALPLRTSVLQAWEDAIRLQRFVRSRFQDGVGLRNGFRTDFQDAIRIQRPVASTFEQALPLRDGRQSRFQDGLRDRRNQTAVRYQEGQRYSIGITTHESRGVPLAMLIHTRYQEAMKPPAGIWIRPGPEPEDPCYIPDPHLLFVEGPGGPDLVFVCERHGPGPQPGETIVVPVKEVYLVINSAVLIRVDTGAVIPTLSMSMSLDVDSWTWSFSASVPGQALADVEPEDDTPVDVQATINGVPYRFVVESVSRERSFNQSSLRLGGRGRAAALDTPYAPIRDFTNPQARTARQLLDDILTDNGVPLGWDIDWKPTDWTVPANVFSHQGSYISAMNAVVGSIGAYLQPHNTAEAMSVLARYPVAPWEWGDVTPDFEIPTAVATREGIEWATKPRYNRVYVSGQQTGVLGRVTRAGSAGDMLAPTAVDALITHADAARQRGIAILSDTGRIASVTLRMPVLAETGIIPPGKFIKYTDGDEERIGITRSVQVDVGLPEVWQSIGIETHVEPV